MDTVRIPGLDIQAELGRGSSGVVYRARETGAGRVVAVKVSHALPSGDPDVNPFGMEYSLHSSLRHLHIVHAHDLAKLDDGRWVYLMRYYDAVALAAFFREGGVESLGEVALKVLHALDYTHGQGILHGDLKPANILVTRAGRRRVDQVAVADFGHAQWLGNASAYYRGTPAYSAPEQQMGLRIDPRADIYSLGSTLFEAMAGRLPNVASNAAEQRDALTAKRPSIADFVPRLPHGWIDLVDSMVAPDASKRPSTAQDAMIEIERLLRRDAAPRAATGVPAQVLFPPTLRYVAYGDTVQQVLRQLRDRGTVRTVLLTGDEGAGKSRLLSEVVCLAQLDGVFVTHADARDAQTSAFRVLDGLRKGGESVETAGEPTADTSSSSDPAAPHIPGAELERRVEFLASGVDGDRDHLYAFDSLESADLDSLALLRRLAGRLRPGELLCLAARSDGDRNVLDSFRGPEVLEIVVHPLDVAGIRSLVDAHLGSVRHAGSPGPPLDDEEMRTLVEWLAAETSGNPQRVEGCLGMLARRGVLERMDAAWRLDAKQLPSADASYSARGQAILALRRFPPRSRSCLRIASVAGPTFDGALVSAASGDPGSTTAEFIAAGLRFGVIVVSNELGSLRFRDPAVARAIAASIPERKLGDIHRRLADVLARAHPDGSFAASVAQHLERAGDLVASRDHYATAALASLRSGAHHEATRFFRRSWDHHVGESRQALPSFAVDWMRSLSMQGRFEEALDVADSLLLATQGVDASSEAGLTVLAIKGFCRVANGSRDEGQRILAGLLGSVAIANYPALQAWALTALGKCEIESNHPDAARRALTAARGIGLAKELPYAAGRAELYLGIQSWREDDADGALAWQARAYDHFVQSKEKDLLPAVWGNQAICYWSLLDARKATTLHRRAAEGYSSRYRPGEAARSYQNLAHILTETGRWDEADAALVAAERLNRSFRERRQESYFFYHRARLALYRGRLQEATEYIERALHVAKPLEDPFVTVGHSTLRGLIELDSTRADDAARTGEECLAASRQINYRWGVAKSLYVLGCAERLAGRSRQALACLDQAVETAKEAKQPVVLFRVQLARAELLAERGDSVSPRLLLRDSTALADRVDSPLWNAWIALASGRIWMRLGNSEKACRSLASAYETFAALGAERHKAETFVAQAEAYTALGNGQAARSAAAQARVLHETLGLPRPSLPVEDLPVAVESSATVTRVLAAAADISRIVATVHRLDEVLERILDVANTYLGTERGVIALADPLTGRLKVRCARNVDRESIADALEISRTALHRVGDEGEVVCSNDALADPRLSQRESVRRLRIRALVALPIRWDNEILGALYLDHRMLTDLFGREEREFLRFIAGMAAIGIRNAHAMERKDDEVRSLREELGDEVGLTHTIVGSGPRMKELFRRGVSAAKEKRVILLSGPTGVGKDHFALAFHEKSGRRGDFVHCALPSITDSLMEAELFGVVRGAATSVEPRVGLLETAQHGTIFLNEIGEMALSVQPKLLAFLDHREFRRVGSPEVHRFGGLIICATNADLQQKVADGTFRDDLFHRLSECVIDLPPLCERAEDIPKLTDLFLEEFAQASGRSRHVVHPLARDVLMRCEWKGNVRELRQCLRRAVDASTTGIIEVHHLDSPSLPDPTQPPPPPPQGFKDEVVAKEILLIVDAMTRSGGSIAEGARWLDIADTTLGRKIRKYGLEHLVRIPRPRRRDLHSLRNPDGWMTPGHPAEAEPDSELSGPETGPDSDPPPL